MSERLKSKEAILMQQYAEAKKNKAIPESMSYQEWKALNG